QWRPGIVSQEIRGAKEERGRLLHVMEAGGFGTLTSHQVENGPSSRCDCLCCRRLGSDEQISLTPLSGGLQVGAGVMEELRQQEANLTRGGRGIDKQRETWEIFAKLEVPDKVVSFRDAATLGDPDSESGRELHWHPDKDQCGAGAGGARLCGGSTLQDHWLSGAPERRERGEKSAGSLSIFSVEEAVLFAPGLPARTAPMNSDKNVYLGRDKGIMRKRALLLRKGCSFEITSVDSAAFVAGRCQSPCYCQNQMLILGSNCNPPGPECRGLLPLGLPWAPVTSYDYDFLADCLSDSSSLTDNQSEPGLKCYCMGK
ncbi:unnamed protein product, partial [Pleuronectes platessa]